MKKILSKIKKVLIKNRKNNIIGYVYYYDEILNILKIKTIYF